MGNVLNLGKLQCWVVSKLFEFGNHDVGGNKLINPLAATTFGGK